MKKLYVGNLSYNTTEAGLRAVAEQDGRAVDRVSIVMDRETGRSRGFAFVEFVNEDDCAAALEALNGLELDGRQLRVNEARERAPRDRGPARGPRPGGGGGGRGRPPRDRPRDFNGPPPNGAMLDAPPDTPRDDGGGRRKRRERKNKRNRWADDGYNEEFVDDGDGEGDDRKRDRRRRKDRDW